MNKADTIRRIQDRRKNLQLMESLLVDSTTPERLKPELYKAIINQIGNIQGLKDAVNEMELSEGQYPNTANA